MLDRDFWVLEGADEFFLLEIDRDSRLSGRLQRRGRPVDPLEPSVSVWMVIAFPCLAIDLTAVVSDFEQRVR